MNSRKSFIYLVCGNVFSKLISILTISYLAHVLSYKELAIFPVYATLSQLSILIFSFGIFPSLLRTVPSLLVFDRNEAKARIFSGMFIVLMGTSFFAIVIYVLRDFFANLFFKSSDMSILIGTMCIGFIGRALREIFRNLLWYSSKFDKMSLLQILESLVRPFLVILLFLKFGVYGLVVALAINEFFYSFLAFIFVRTFLKNFLKKIPKLCHVYSLIKESLPFYFESYLLYFRQQGDNWIIATYLGPKAISIYYIAKTFYSSLLLIIESFDKIIVIKLSSLKNQPLLFYDRLVYLFQLIFYLIFPFIFTVIGLLPTFIFLIGGQKYSNALYPSVILCLSLLVMILRLPLGRTVFVLMKPTVRVRITLVESVLLLSLLFIFTSHFNIIGVALSRLITNIVIFVFICYLLKRRKTITIPFSVQMMIYSLVASLLMCVFLWYCQLFHFNIVFFIFYLILGIIIFLSVMTLFARKEFWQFIEDAFRIKISIISRIVK